MELPSLYLSRYIVNNRNGYYKKLRLVTEKENWHDWVMYMLDMIEQTASTGGETIMNIEDLMKETGELI